jgi:hypothetical protein
MEFLISSDWILAEAQALHINVSVVTVRREFARIRGEQFPKLSEFRAFLVRSGQTMADLLFRVRVNITSERTQRHVLARHHGARRKARALRRFLGSFKTKWMARTFCEPAFIVPYCGHVQTAL